MEDTNKIENLKLDETQTNQTIETNIEDKKELIEEKKVIHVVDTAFFIQLKSIDTKKEYFTTQFVVDEIRDEKAREHYNLNKVFIKIQNPTKKAMKDISSFAKKSNDLFNLSITDLSVIALAYDLCSVNLQDKLRMEPKEWIIKKREKKPPKEKPEEDEEGFIEVKSGKKESNDDDADYNLWKDFEGDSDWINSNNIDDKLSKYNKYEKSGPIDEASQQGIFVITDDYTMQNVLLKMGISVLSTHNLLIKRVKNFLFKCLSCNTFNFDTTIKFCQECGYNYLMKIGYFVNNQGEGIIFDKDPEVRVRGTIYDLPKPTIGKKSTVYILCEDQLPKKKEIDIDKVMDKILDNYDNLKDLSKVKKSTAVYETSSSKNLEWGFPKKNPNASKKYYGKKTKK